MTIKRLLIILGRTAAFLVIPFVAMQFSKDVNWTGTQFLVTAVLLFTVSVILEIILKKVKTNKQRVLIGMGVVFVFLLLWAELAVGVFGSPLAGN